MPWRRGDSSLKLRAHFVFLLCMAEHVGVEKYSYQHDALAALRRDWRAGGRQGLLHMATASGKTALAAWFLEELLAEQPRARVLWLAHREGLVDQAANTVSDALGVTSRGYGRKGSLLEKQFTFSTLQTAVRRLPEIDPEHFPFIVVDEAHHAPAESFAKVMRHFRPQYRLGLTATAKRLDGQSLEPYFGRPTFEFDLPTALKGGWLAKVDYRLIAGDSIDQLQLSKAQLRGLSIAQLNRRLFIPQQEEAIAETVLKHLSQLENPRAIGYCRSIEHAERTAASLPDALAIHSALTASERRRRMDAFRAGEVSTITGIDIPSEGLDVPDVNVLFFLRQTDSYTVYLQQLGRGLRRHPGKEKVTVLDFVGSVERVAYLQSLVDSIRPSGSSPKEPVADHIEIAGVGDFKFDLTSVELLQYLEAREHSYTPEGMIAAGVAEVAYLKQHPELQTVERTLRGQSVTLRALSPSGVLTQTGIEQAASAGRMAPLDAITAEFRHVDDSGKRGRSVAPYQAALADALGVAPPLQSATMTRPELLRLAVLEVELIKADPSLGMVSLPGRGKRALVSALTAEGVLSNAGVVQASAAGRMPSVTTVRRLFPAEGSRSAEHRNRPASIRAFQEALAEQLEIELKEPVAWTRSSAIEASVAEIERLQGLPQPAKVTTARGSLNAFTKDGLLSVSAIDAAAAEGRLPSSQQIALLFDDDGDQPRIRSVAPYNRSMAERLGFDITEQEWTRDTALDAAEREVERIENGVGGLPTESRRESLLNKDGLLTHIGIAEAAKAGRMPSLATIQELFAIESKPASIIAFQQALAQRMGRTISRPPTVEELVIAAKAEVELLRSRPDLQAAPALKRGREILSQTLTPDGLLTIRGVQQAFEAGRLPSLNTIRTVMGDDKGLAVLNDQLRPLLPPYSLEQTPQQVVGDAAAEIALIKADPSLLVVEGRGGRAALNSEGLLTNAAIERAASAGRMASLSRIAKIFSDNQDGGTSPMVRYQDALYLEVHGRERRRAWSSEDAIEAAVAEIRAIRSGAQPAVVEGPAGGRPASALRSDGTLAPEAINRAARELRMPSCSEIAAIFDESPSFRNRQLPTFNAQVGERLGLRVVEGPRWAKAQDVVAVSVDEIRRINSTPELQLVNRTMKDGSVQQWPALLEDGTLSDAAIERAADEWRMPRPNTIRSIIKGGKSAYSAAVKAALAIDGPRGEVGGRIHGGPPSAPQYTAIPAGALGL